MPIPAELISESPSESRPATVSRVLCVDLDGTLVATDLLWESVFSVLRTRPWAMLAAPFWLCRGRAHLKQKLALAAQIDFATLPYRKSLLRFLEAERRRGRAIVLSTAADYSLATAVAGHVGLFTRVLASDGVTNLKGSAKAALLVREFGSGNFDYIGDSRADIPCWERASTALTTNPAWSIRVPGVKLLVEPQPGVARRITSVVRAVRPHQWVKNLLLVVPPLGAHQFGLDTAVVLGLAIASFSLCASGGYILNDLLDLSADRRHARKASRPFAAGDLSLSSGLVLVLATWALGFGIAAWLLPFAFLAVVASYLVATAAYSIRLKREPVLDVMFLAGLYVLRVIGGGVATGVAVSTWLLAFTLFVCLSLAFLKRFIEVDGYANGELASVPGRGYAPADAAWLQSAGIVSGYLSAVVLALYATSADVSRLYSHPDRLLLLCPILLYWATRIWVQAQRRLVHDDPVVAVSRDPVTYVVALISALTVWVSV